MSTSNIRSVALTVALFTVLPASATDAWHSAPGEAGVTFHPEHLQTTLTREQYLAQWAAERREQAARGYKWDVLYSTYVFIGPGSPPAAAGTMTREEYLAREEAEKRQMQGKGMKWNQLFGTYQR
jgi:hypothetical protein